MGQIYSFLSKTCTYCYILRRDVKGLKYKFKKLWSCIKLFYPSRNHLSLSTLLQVISVFVFLCTIAMAMQAAETTRTMLCFPEPEPAVTVYLQHTWQGITFK